MAVTMRYYGTQYRRVVGSEEGHHPDLGGGASGQSAASLLDRLTALEKTLVADGLFRTFFENQLSNSSMRSLFSGTTAAAAFPAITRSVPMWLSGPYQVAWLQPWLCS